MVAVALGIDPSGQPVPIALTPTGSLMVSGGSGAGVGNGAYGGGSFILMGVSSEGIPTPIAVGSDGSLSGAGEGATYTGNKVITGTLDVDGGGMVIGPDEIRATIPYHYDGTGNYIQRNAVVTLARETLAPTGVQPMLHIVAIGRGDNSTFIGVSGGYIQARDDAAMLVGQRGVLYGLQISAVPRFARSNVPFDDVACLVLQHEGATGTKGTDCLYIGHNDAFTAGAFEWISGVLIEANANYAFRATGTYQYGIRLDEATLSGAMLLGNNAGIYQEHTNGTAILVSGIDTNNALLLRDGNWRIDGNGHLQPATFLTGAADLGASTRALRDIYMARNLINSGGYMQLAEMVAPSAAPAEGVRIYAVDNGAGKTQLMAIFASGVAQQLAIQP